jgi:hypothetical protein
MLLLRMTDFITRTAPIAARDPRARRTAWLAVTRARAFFIHLIISALLLGTALPVLLTWYPEPYFTAVRAWEAVRVQVGVFLAAGPLLTLILFKPGKRGLLFDVVVVALLQLIALGHGLTVLHRDRPSFAVFALDRFFVLGERDVDRAQLSAARAASRLNESPHRPALLVANLPTDAAERDRLLEETVFEGKPDIERRPELWRSFDSRQVLSRQKTVAALRAARPDAASEIDEAVARLGVTELNFVPLVAGERHVAAIVDARTGAPLAVVDTDPWLDD